MADDGKPQGPHAHTTPGTVLAPVGETQRRKACILQKLGGPNVTRFTVAANPDANASKPLIEAPSQSTVNQYNAMIEAAAKAESVPADLIRAIMYMETTHGYYDKAISWGEWNKSILPMNINVEFWGDAFGTRDDLKKPGPNINAGAKMLARIIACLPDKASVEQIATVYNHLGATKVNNYGARVGAIHREKLWQKAP
jgi:hypothetical protein